MDDERENLHQKPNDSFPHQSYFHYQLKRSNDNALLIVLIDHISTLSGKE